MNTYLKRDCTHEKEKKELEHPKLHPIESRCEVDKKFHIYRLEMKEETTTEELLQHLPNMNDEKIKQECKRGQINRKTRNKGETQSSHTYLQRIRVSRKFCRSLSSFAVPWNHALGSKKNRIAQLIHFR